jgi:hypothetical protein
MSGTLFLCLLLKFDRNAVIISNCLTTGVIAGNTRHLKFAITKLKVAEKNTLDMGGSVIIGYV